MTPSIIAFKRCTCIWWYRAKRSHDQWSTDVQMRLAWLAQTCILYFINSLFYYPRFLSVERKNARSVLNFNRIDLHHVCTYMCVVVVLRFTLSSISVLLSRSMRVLFENIFMDIHHVLNKPLHGSRSSSNTTFKHSPSRSKQRHSVTCTGVGSHLHK